MTDKIERVAMDLISPVPFLKHMLSLFSGVSFGGDVAGCGAADWIQGAGYPSVRNEINRGTQIWAYRNVAGELVGFGSLGVTKWDFQGSKRPIQYIPMLAVCQAHQGRPTSASIGPRYSRQIISHLLDEAERRLATSELIGLSVLSDNAKAIRLYTHAGFEWLTSDRQAGRMLMRLG